MPRLLLHFIITALLALGGGSQSSAHGDSWSRATALRSDSAHRVPILHQHDYHYLPRLHRGPWFGHGTYDYPANDGLHGWDQDQYPRHRRYFEQHYYARAHLGSPGLLFIQRD